MINVFLSVGFCLQASDGNLTHASCMGFPSGCPETPYITSDFYKCKLWKLFPRYLDYSYKEKTLILRLYFLDSACQELNLKHNCYKFDPHCPTKDNIETNDIPSTISILVVYLGLAIVFLALFCFLTFCRLSYGM